MTAVIPEDIDVLDVEEGDTQQESGDDTSEMVAAAIADVVDGAFTTRRGRPIRRARQRVSYAPPARRGRDKKEKGKDGTLEEVLRLEKEAKGAREDIQRELSALKELASLRMASPAEERTPPPRPLEPVVVMKEGKKKKESKALEELERAERKKLSSEVMIETKQGMRAKDSLSDRKKSRSAISSQTAKAESSDDREEKKSKSNVKRSEVVGKVRKSLALDKGKSKKSAIEQSDDENVGGSKDFNYGIRHNSSKERRHSTLIVEDEDEDEDEDVGQDDSSSEIASEKESKSRGITVKAKSKKIVDRRKPKKKEKKELDSDDTDSDDQSEAEEKKRTKKSSVKAKGVGEKKSKKDSKKGSKAKAEVAKKKRKSKKFEYSSDSSSSESSDSSLETSDTDQSDVEQENNHSRRRGRQPKELSMDTFSGKSEDTPVGTFLAQFRIVAKQNGWPRKQWNLELVAKLRGEARALILPDEDTKVPSFERVTKKLKKHFDGDEDPETYEEELKGKLRGPKETVRELQQWIKVTSRRAFPEITSSSVLDRMMKRTFENALTNEDQRDYVEKSEARNMSEAASAALKWEAINKNKMLRKKAFGKVDRPAKVQVQQMTREVEEDEVHVAQTISQQTAKKWQKPKPQVQQPQLQTSAYGLTKDDLTQALQEVLKANEERSTSAAQRSGVPAEVKQKPAGAWTPRRCFNCNEEGHMVANCTKPPRPPPTCFNCNEVGHLAKYCLKPVKCNRCQGFGHWAGQCPSNVAGQTGNDGGGSRSGQAAQPPPSKQ